MSRFTTRLFVSFSLVTSVTLAIAVASPVLAFDKGAARERACASEPTPTRREICLDRQLTRMDAALNEVYGELSRQMSKADFNSLRSEQRDWLRERDLCGARYQCINDIYTDRLAILEQMSENLANPGKSHVEIGCQGPGRRFVNGNCIIDTGSGPDGEFVWQATGFNDPGNKGRYTARLVHGVPETDNVAFEAVCDAGSTDTSAPVTIGYNTSGYREGDSVPITITIDGTRYSYNGRIYGTTREEGVSGVLFRPDYEDAFWEALAGGQSVTYRVRSGATASLGLRGSGSATRKFIADCKAISGAPRYQNAGNTPSRPTPAATQPGCDKWGKVRSQNSNTPIQITFTNRTQATRGVMWINFEGTPVEYANLDPGQTFTINTFLTHPWMFTDGPGNCMELMLPQPGLTRYDINAPSPAFGPGND